MKKPLIITLSIVAAVIILITAFVSASIISSNNKQRELTTALNSIEGIAQASYEVQHPGLPTNNTIVIFAALEAPSPETMGVIFTQVAQEVQAADLYKNFTVSMYAVDARELRQDELFERDTYFGNKGAVDMETLILKPTEGIRLFKNQASVYSDNIKDL